MKKKLLYGLLCVCLLGALGGCGKKNDEGTTNDTTAIEDSASSNEGEDVTGNETEDISANEVAEPGEDPGTVSDGNAGEDSISDNEINTDLSEDTLGGKLYLNFLAQIQTENDIEAVANAISTEEITGYSCVVMPSEEGYLAGFDEEITGFDKAVCFAPMISTIPMVGYIFEVENPEEFKNMLAEKANPAWNICTQADEMVVEVYGNYVFFVMCPNVSE
ncbi:MAG: hypothetical protein ACI4DU_10585 [Lachnospiraceae bacterium]